MTMRITTLLAAFAAALVLAAPAGAATTEACQTQIGDLRAATAAVTTFANQRDQDRLIGKLDEAARELAAGKPGDATRKLGDFRLKVQSLGAAGKLDAGDAAGLDAAAASAVGCIESIGV
jgi:hypothetical protein